MIPSIRNFPWKRVGIATLGVFLVGAALSYLDMPLFVAIMFGAIAGLLAVLTASGRGGW